MTEQNWDWACRALSSLFMLGLLTFVSGCAMAYRDDAGTQIAPGYEFTGERSGGGLLDAAEGESFEPTASVSVGDDAPEAIERLRTYRAWLELAVARPDLAAVAFVERCEELGGYLVSKDDDTYLCRVPTKHFQTVLEELRDRGAVRGEQIEVQDVTAEVFDIEIRLDNAKRSRDRLLALLDKTDDVKAVLEIERELRRLTTEIEQYEGQLRVLRNDIRYSRIEVVFESAASESRIKAESASSFSWIRRIGIQPALDAVRNRGQ